jgi:hypothetical protein
MAYKDQATTTTTVAFLQLKMQYILLFLPMMGIQKYGKIQNETTATSDLTDTFCV